MWAWPLTVGQETFTFLLSGTPPSIEVPAGPYPYMVASDDGRQVPVVQAYAFGKYLGFLQLTFDPEGNVVGSSGNPILLNSSIPQGRAGRPSRTPRLLRFRPNPTSLPDPDVLAEVEDWKKNLANYSSQQVGKTLVFLDGTNEMCRFAECNLGNLICDAMVTATFRIPTRTGKWAPSLSGLTLSLIQVNNYIRQSTKKTFQWNLVSAAIINGGGIRSSIDERHNNGEDHKVLAHRWAESLTHVVCRFPHHGAADGRPTVRRNLRPGPAERFHAEEGF